MYATATTGKGPETSFLSTAVVLGCALLETQARATLEWETINP